MYKKNIKIFDDLKYIYIYIIKNRQPIKIEYEKKQSEQTNNK